MKICVVSDFFIPHYQGGGERRHYEILKRLVKKGHQVDLICMKIKGVKKYEKIDGINVYHIGPKINKPPKRGLLDFLNFTFASFVWIILRDYDIVEAQGIGLLPVSLVGKLKRAKSVAVIHDISSGKPDQWLSLSFASEFAEKLLVKLPFDKIINVSKGVKKRLVKEYRVNPRKIKVVNNGVDIELIDGVEVKKKDKHSVIYVGRLIPHKHVDDLLVAISILIEDIPDINLKVIGWGQELKELKKLAKKLEIEKNVKFFGMLPNYKTVIREIKKSSLLVLPSTREGFGMVLVEAFACKVPCIAYYSDGVVEVIDDKKNGYLVEQRNVDELADKIEVLLRNNKRARLFAKRGRKKTEENFVWDSVANKVGRLYSSVLKAK